MARLRPNRQDTGRTSRRMSIWFFTVVRLVELVLHGGLLDECDVENHDEDTSVVTRAPHET